MSNNASHFDPLNPTPEERADMMMGWLAAVGNEPKPAITSAAFDHSWRMAMNDRAGVVDDDQRELARRLLRRHETPDQSLARLKRDIALYRQRSGT